MTVQLGMDVTMTMAVLLHAHTDGCEVTNNVSFILHT